MTTKRKKTSKRTPQKQETYTRPLSKFRRALENLGASYLRTLIAAEKLKNAKVFKDIKASKIEIEKYLNKKVKKGFQLDYVIIAEKGNKKVVYVIDVKSTLRHPHIEKDLNELAEKLKLAHELKLIPLLHKIEKKNIAFVVVFLHFHKHLSEKNAMRKAKLNAVKLIHINENTGKAKILN